MSQKKIYQIGVMIGNVHTQHPMELIRGICEASKGEDVNVTFFVGAQGSALEFWSSNAGDLSAYNYQYNSLYDYSLIAGLDALIISYGTLCIYLEKDDREEFASKFRSVPLVILEEYDESSCDSFLISDNYSSMYRIMDHLLSVHGYKKILYLSGPKNNTDSNERQRAYIDAMKAYGLEVTDDMVEYGDYSSDVDALVERLLDRYPYADAIAAANDEMALSIYRVCKKRGIVVGRDLAVTGYDNVDFAQRLDPPLTTADQDGLDMGYRALKCAVSLCRDPKPVKMKLPARFINRRSCGCGMHQSDVCNGISPELFSTGDENGENAISSIVSHAVESSFKSIAAGASYDNGRMYFAALLDLLQGLSGDDKDDCSKKALELIKVLCDKEGDGALDFSGFSEAFRDIMKHYMEKAAGSLKVLALTEIMSVTDAYVESYVMRSLEERIGMLLNKSWTAPATIQYMIENVEDESAFYRLAIENIITQGAKSAYLYLLPEPIKCDRDYRFVCPDKLELAAECADGVMKAYLPGERPVISKEEGFSVRYPDTGEHTYIAFMLFAKTFQYGIMICEIEAVSIGLLYGVALQISTAQAYMQISKRENKTKKKLYATLKELEDKNQVLSFVSATDALTGLYNRRGFMEQAMAEVSAHTGKKAAIFFSDLDHLKQINDVFGHKDGDFALEHAALMLKETVFGFRKEGTVCGRIGGDEFVSLMICEEDTDADEVLKLLSERCKSFNDACDKPYYVEFSTGCVEFVCSDKVPVAELTGQADACLYEAKKSRRESVLKS